MIICAPLRSICTQIGSAFVPVLCVAYGYLAVAQFLKSGGRSGVLFEHSSQQRRRIHPSRVHVPEVRTLQHILESGNTDAHLLVLPEGRFLSTLEQAQVCDFRLYPSCKCIVFALVKFQQQASGKVFECLVWRCDVWSFLSCVSPVGSNAREKRAQRHCACKGGSLTGGGAIDRLLVVHMSTNARRRGVRTTGLPFVPSCRRLPLVAFRCVRVRGHRNKGATRHVNMYEQAH